MAAVIGERNSGPAAGTEASVFVPLEQVWSLHEYRRQEVFLDTCRRAVEHSRLSTANGKAAMRSLTRWTEPPATLRERALAAAALAAISVLATTNDDDHDNQEDHKPQQRIAAACESWVASLPEAPSPDPSETEAPSGAIGAAVLSQLASQGERWRGSACVARLVSHLGGEGLELDYRVSVSVPGRGGTVGQIDFALHIPGVGAQYFDPVAMPFFQPDRAFLSGVDLAWRLVRARCPMSPTVDVVWQVSVGTQLLETAVGSSIGLAAVSGFTRLLTPRRRWQLPVRTNLCFTGALDPSLDGSVISVDGYDEKVKVIPGGWSLIYPAVDARELARAANSAVGPPRRWKRKTIGVWRT